MKTSFMACFLFGIILFLSGCTQQGKIIPVEGNEVTINHFVFEPQELVVAVGTTVTWKHNDNVAHTVFSQGSFESETLNKGDTFTFMFTKPGEYSYFCSIHPSMSGKIIVQ